MCICLAGNLPEYFYTTEDLYPADNLFPSSKIKKPGSEFNLAFLFCLDSF